MEDIRQTIAENILSLRSDRGMTQLELAEVLNYSDKAISKWERGESIPDVITLKAMADLFGVTVDYIITSHDPGEHRRASRVTRNNHIFITLISVVSVWVLGTCVFSISAIVGEGLWISFIACVPVSCLVLMIFNSIWGRPRLNLLCISAFMWSLLLMIYLIFIVYTDLNLWTLFFIGVPAQVAFSLGLGIRRPKSKSSHEVKQLIMKNRRKKKTEDQTAVAGEDDTDAVDEK